MTSRGESRDHIREIESLPYEMVGLRVHQSRTFVKQVALAVSVPNDLHSVQQQRIRVIRQLARARDAGPEVVAVNLYLHNREVHRPSYRAAEMG